MQAKLDALFYDPTIYESCERDELFTDGFMDPAYEEVEDLTDEMLFRWMTERLAGVEDAVDFGVPHVFNGIKSTTYGVMTSDDNGLTVSLGCTEVKPPNFEIQPDYLPAKLVLDWYFEYMEKPDIEFIYVPVAEPVIPHVAKEKPASSDDIDELMQKCGSLIFCPSYTFQEKRLPDEYVSLNWDDKKAMDKQVEERMVNHSYLYSSRSNYVWHWTKNYKVFALEFNPFHPMSMPYIRSFEDDGKVIRGTYRWGRRTRDFYFHRKSVKFRLHYEVWGSLFSYKNHYLSMFDLVGNFDLRELKLFNIPQRIFSFKPRYVVEGYFPAERDDVFSNIRQKRRNQRRGEDEIFSFYSNVPIRISSKGSKYLDITSLYELRYYSLSRWELFVVHRETGRTIVSLVFTDKKNVQKQDDPRLFIQYSMRANKLKVYILDELATDFERDSTTKHKYLLYCEGSFFFGVPRNEKGSLIKNPAIRSFSDYMKIAKLGPQVDMLEELMPENVGEFATDEILSPGEVQRIRESMGHEYFEDVYEDFMMCDEDGG